MPFQLFRYFLLLILIGTAWASISPTPFPSSTPSQQPFKTPTLQPIYITPKLPISEMRALDAFYTSTHGYSWRIPKKQPVNMKPFTLWNLTGVHNPCSDNWIGVVCSCSQSNCTVISLLLHDLDIGGTIPDQIAHLRNLQNLQLSNNRINGTLPSGIGTLTSLQNLNLDLNHINGFIPDSFKFLKSMVNFNVTQNFLKGPVLDISAMTNLVTIDLSFNALSGKLSGISFQNLKALKLIRIANNFLTGSLPSALGEIGVCLFVRMCMNVCVCECALCDVCMCMIIMQQTRIALSITNS